MYQEVLESYPQLFDITSEVLEGLEKNTTITDKDNLLSQLKELLDSTSC
ncbi:hypothetical protein [Cetobacterium sp.]